MLASWIDAFDVQTLCSLFPRFCLHVSSVFSEMLGSDLFAA